MAIGKAANARNAAIMEPCMLRERALNESAVNNEFGCGQFQAEIYSLTKMVLYHLETLCRYIYRNSCRAHLPSKKQNQATASRDLV